MRTQTLQTEIWLPRPLDEVFAFFSDAGNLDRLTPSWLRFEILTPRPITMRPGALIDYRLRLRGIPIRWRSEITAWDPPLRFVDEQRSGPYRLWRHQHIFAARDGGTVVGDHVEYAVWGGALVDKLFVERDVRAIFRYRQQTLQALFGVRGSFAGSEREMTDARAAQAGWALKPVHERLECIRRLRHLLAERAGQLAAASAGARNRPVSESLTAEVVPLAEACRFLEREAAGLLKPRRIGRTGRPLWLSGVFSEIRHEPHGVVLIIGPSNYPLFLPGVQALQALVAGNAVVIKPGAGGGAVMAMFAGLLREAGLDARLLSVLSEAPESAQAAIEQGVNKVVLTGSAPTGAKVLQQLAPRLVPATMELSGCDAVIVRADADLDLVVRALVFGLRLNGSATCIAPRRVLVADALAAGLEAKLVAAFARCEAMPIEGRTAERLQPLLQEAIAGGARLVCGAMRPDGRIEGPVVLAGTRQSFGLLREDIFAPVMSLVAVKDDADALASNALCPYALGASIFSRAERAANELAARIPAGVVIINDLIAPTADPRLPFGGRGRSGFGVTRGAEGLLEMTVAKVITVNRSRWRLHYDGPGPDDAVLFESWLRLAHGAGLKRRVQAAAGLVRAAMRRRPKGGAS